MKCGILNFMASREYPVSLLFCSLFLPHCHFPQDIRKANRTVVHSFDLRCGSCSTWATRVPTLSNKRQHGFSSFNLQTHLSLPRNSDWTWFGCRELCSCVLKPRGPASTRQPRPTPENNQIALKLSGQRCHFPQFPSEFGALWIVFNQRGVQFANVYIQIVM